MTDKPIIDVDIDTSAFDDFRKKYEEFQKATQGLPGDWAKAAEQANKQKSIFEKMLQLLPKLAPPQRDASIIDDVPWISIASSSKHTLKFITDATLSLGKWTALTSVFGSIIGAGGLYGINRMAASISQRRRDASSVGAPPGEVSNFETQFARLGIGSDYISHVNELQRDPAQRHVLYGVGGKQGGDKLLGESSANAAADLLPMIKKLASQRFKDPKQIDAMAQAYGLDPTLVRTIMAMPADELESLVAQYHAGQKGFDLSPDVLRKWSDLNRAFQEAGGEIEVAFQNKLVLLTPEISQVAIDLGKIIDSAIQIGGPVDQLVKGPLKTGIERFGSMMESGNFRAATETFLQKSLTAVHLLEAISWPGIAGAYAGAKLGGLIAGPPGAAIGALGGAALGSNFMGTLKPGAGPSGRNREYQGAGGDPNSYHPSETRHQREQREKSSPAPAPAPAPSAPSAPSGLNAAPNVQRAPSAAPAPSAPTSTPSGAKGPSSTAPSAAPSAAPAPAPAPAPSAPAPVTPQGETPDIVQRFGGSAGNVPVPTERPGSNMPTAPAPPSRPGFGDGAVQPNAGGFSGSAGPTPPSRPAGNVASPGIGGEAGALHGVSTAGVNPSLVEAVRKAQAVLPPGWHVVVTSARGGRNAGSSQHSHGRALDVRIFKPDGTPVPNEGPDTTGMYHRFHAAVYQNLPESEQRHMRSGGQFGTRLGGGGPVDWMHVDVGLGRGGPPGGIRPGTERPIQEWGPKYNFGKPPQTAPAAPPESAPALKDRTLTNYNGADAPPGKIAMPPSDLGEEHGEAFSKGGSSQPGQAPSSASHMDHPQLQGGGKSHVKINDNSGGEISVEHKTSTSGALVNPTGAPSSRPGSQWIDVKGNFNRDFNQPSSSPGSGGGGQTPASSPGGQTPDFAGYAKDAAEVESRGGTMKDRRGSKYHGKYQMGPGYGGTGTEEERFARGTELNRQQLKRSLGREPTHTELYMAHQQGARAAGKMGGHPDRTPHELGVRDKNITENHGDPNRPAKDFINKWAPTFHEPGVGGPGPSPLPLAT